MMMSEGDQVSEILDIYYLTEIPGTGEMYMAAIFRDVKQ